jgi:hypothetical protein
VTPTHYLTVDDQDRANRDAAFGQPDSGFVDGSIEERVGHEEMLRARGPAI